MHISSAFDGGNIEVVAATDPTDVQLLIRKDGNADFRQWFYFRVSGAKGADLALRILNGDQIAYKEGFRGYQAVASHDRATWRRVPTEFDGTVMTIRHRPEADSAWYAYFAPYSLERHADHVARLQQSPHVRLEVLGRTCDGRDIDYLRVGEPGAGKLSVWMIGRQHPGETMASWWMEGALDRLTDPADPVARALLESCVFHVVPNMNPDGSHRGHLRTNAAGKDLNRQWLAPSLELAPEVYLVRRRMEETGVDVCIDVHGDEEIPHNFLAGYHGIPDLRPNHQALFDAYKAALAAASPDFQTVHGYPPNPPGRANMGLCTNWVAWRFGALAATLEMPFKDTADCPDPVHGWSPERSRRLGAACLDALRPVLPKVAAWRAQAAVPA